MGKVLSRQLLEKQVERFKGYLLGLEGGRLIDNDLGYLRSLRERGVRYLTLTHNRNTEWAGSSTDEPKELTPLGLEVLRECEALGILVDVSHASDETTSDVLEFSERPVIATHSGCRTILNHPRNLPNNLIEEIAQSNGIVGVPFAKKFVGPTADDFWDHVDYLIKLVGDNHVAIGSDLDGAEMINEVFNVSDWGSIVLHHPRAKKYSSETITKLAGGNALRVLNERV